MTAINWNVKIKEALARTDIMALSTIGDEGSWTSPVQYSHSSKLELYFLSLKDSKHVMNIVKDPRVSLAIYHPEAPPNGGHIGLQIKGTSKLVGEGKWMRFEIIPEEIWYFDSKMSHNREKINLNELNLSE
jgi:general stress protein 26